MTPLSKFATASLLLALLVGGGCAAFDAAAVRSTQQREFTNRLATAADELLAEPLTLDACLAIAMTNNYTARLADIKKEEALTEHAFMTWPAFAAAVAIIMMVVGYLFSN